MNVAFNSVFLQRGDRGFARIKIENPRPKSATANPRRFIPAAVCADFMIKSNNIWWLRCLFFKTVYWVKLRLEKYGKFFDVFDQISPEKYGKFSKKIFRIYLRKNFPKWVKTCQKKNCFGRVSMGPKWSILSVLCAKFMFRSKKARFFVQDGVFGQITPRKIR